MSYLVEQLDRSPFTLSIQEQENVIKSHYQFIASEVTDFVQGVSDRRGLIVNGPAGGGKTSLIRHTLTTLGVEHHIISGTISAPVMFEKLYRYARKPNQFLVIDDTDVVFNDTEMSDLLKAALDGQGKMIQYGKANSAHLRINAIPSEFVCEGRVIFITNMNMDPAALTKKHQATLRPVKDRSEYVKFGLTKEWNSVMFRVFYNNGLIKALNDSNLTQEQKDEIIDFVCEQAKTNDRFTFRTIIKCINRIQRASDWQNHVLLSV